LFHGRGEEIEALFWWIGSIDYWRLIPWWKCILRW
jgi:hypothetical protein